MRESKNIYVRKVEEDARRRGGYTRLANGRFSEDVETKRHTGEVITYSIPTNIYVQIRKHV